jgi:hypothetical protein
MCPLKAARNLFVAAKIGSGERKIVPGKTT